MILISALLLLVDQAPSLIVREPLRDSTVTPSCRHPIDAEAWAPAGVTRLVIDYQVISQNFRDALRLAHEFEKDEISREDDAHYVRGRWTLDLSEFGLIPGDLVRIRLRAESGGASAQSKELCLSIVNPETLRKDLGAGLDRVQGDLAAELLRQDLTRESTRWLGEDLARGKTPSEARLQRVALEQAELGADLRRAARELRQLLDRCTENDLFPPAWRQSLRGVVQDLEAQVPVSATLNLGSPQKLADARKFQDDCHLGISRTLEALRKLPR